MIGTHVRFHLRSAWRDVAKAHGLAAEELGALAARPYGYGLEETQADAEAGEEAPTPEEADPEWGTLYPPAAETGHGDLEPAALLPLDPAVLADCAALQDAPRH